MLAAVDAGLVVDDEGLAAVGDDAVWAAGGGFSVLVAIDDGVLVDDGPFGIEPKR